MLHHDVRGCDAVSAVRRPFRGKGIEQNRHRWTLVIPARHVPRRKAATEHQLLTALHGAITGAEPAGRKRRPGKRAVRPLAAT